MTPRTHHRRRRLGLTAVSLLLAVGCASPAGQPEGTTPQARQQLLDNWRLRADAPAAVAGVREASGTTWVGASGTRRRGVGAAVKPTTVFRIASITKVFVAVVVLQLVEEGELGLDDPVSTHLPDSLAAGVTVRQLLNHTSGLPDYAQDPELQAELLTDRDRRWTSAEVLALVEGNTRQFDPGAGYEYSNTNYVVLGELIEAVTGTTWADQVRSRILSPLHLEHTAIPGDGQATVHMLPGYFDTDNDGDEENVEDGRSWPALETTEGPAGAMVATAGDLLVFGDALFRGDLLHRSSLQAMVAEGPFHSRTSNYGLGLEISKPDYQTAIWGHGGFLPGFRSVLWYVPSRDAVIVVLTNESRANPADLAELLMWPLEPVAGPQ